MVTRFVILKYLRYKQHLARAEQIEKYMNNFLLYYIYLTSGEMALYFMLQLLKPSFDSALNGLSYIISLPIIGYYGFYVFTVFKLIRTAKQNPKLELEGPVTKLEGAIYYVKILSKNKFSRF